MRLRKKESEPYNARRERTDNPCLDCGYVIPGNRCAASLQPELAQRERGCGRWLGQKCGNCRSFIEEIAPPLGFHHVDGFFTSERGVGSASVLPKPADCRQLFDNKRLRHARPNQWMDGCPLWFTQHGHEDIEEM